MSKNLSNSLLNNACRILTDTARQYVQHDAQPFKPYNWRYLSILRHKLWEYSGTVWTHGYKPSNASKLKIAPGRYIALHNPE